MKQKYKNETFFDRYHKRLQKVGVGQKYSILSKNMRKAIILWYITIFHISLFLCVTCMIQESVHNVFFFVFLFQGCDKGKTFK